MLPHPQHTTDELHMMVHWIYSLKEGAGGPSLTRALEGQTQAPADPDISTCVLDASFTDAGRDAVPALVGQASISLRSRKFEAESAAEIKGPMTLGFGRASGQKGLGSIGDHHQVRFTGIPLAQCGKITCRVASAGTGGVIEVHAGKPEGDLLAKLDVTPTGDWDRWVELTAPLAPGHQREDVWIVFLKPGVSGGVMNLDWVRFEPPAK